METMACTRRKAATSVVSGAAVLLPAFYRPPAAAQRQRHVDGETERTAFAWHQAHRLARENRHVNR
jgi:hypothetical protein